MVAVFYEIIFIAQIHDAPEVMIPAAIDIPVDGAGVEAGLAENHIVPAHEMPEHAFDRRIAISIASGIHPCFCADDPVIGQCIDLELCNLPRIKVDLCLYAILFNERILSEDVIHRDSQVFLMTGDKRKRKPFKASKGMLRLIHRAKHQEAWNGGLVQGELSGADDRPLRDEGNPHLCFLPRGHFEVGREFREDLRKKLSPGRLRDALRPTDRVDGKPGEELAHKERYAGGILLHQRCRFRRQVPIVDLCLHLADHLPDRSERYVKRRLFAIGGRYIIHHIAHDHAIHDVCKDLIVLALAGAKEALILTDKDTVSYGRNTRRDSLLHSGRHAARTRDGDAHFANRCRLCPGGKQE